MKSPARAEKTVDDMIGCGVNVIRDGKWAQIGWFHFVTAPRLGDHILIHDGERVISDTKSCEWHT